MPTNLIATPRYPTHQEIQRGIARGRRERSRAFTAMGRTALDFLIGRKVKHIAGGDRTAPQPG